ncbi:hypothetical protein [Bradyrhizobium sp. CCBAU 051011]|uniref:hypothetical protein n=1 Tax=Bradyrhizobium sp. CCBAU 051011 TaxID=858422 RepID=UPI00352A37CA
MRKMAIAALGPRPRKTSPAAGHKIYPYLLRKLTIGARQSLLSGRHHLHPGRTGLPLSGGDYRLGEPRHPGVASVETRWMSRSAWRRDALPKHGKPEIFNTDQAGQFTSSAFTGALSAARIRISMDGRGRWMDNVFIERVWRSLKLKDIYL